jgi:cell division protein FtsB
MKFKFALAFVLVLFAVQSSFAQLGSGIVYDPTNYKNAVLRYLQLQKQLQQLQQSYNVHMQQFMFLQSQARQLQNMVARYRAIPTLWTNLSAANTLGNTSRWVNGINTGTYSIAQQGYGQINRSLSDPTGLNTYDGLKRSYGLEELSDGSTINGMATIGELRNHAEQLETHIKQLEDDSLSSDSDLNTQVAVLNKINAGSVLLVRTMQDTNKLLASLLEQQLVTTERNRTSNVGSINSELYRQQHFSDVMSFTSSMPNRLQTPGSK